MRNFEKNNTRKADTAVIANYYLTVDRIYRLKDERKTAGMEEGHSLSIQIETLESQCREFRPQI